MPTNKSPKNSLGKYDLSSGRPVVMDIVPKSKAISSKRSSQKEDHLDKKPATKEIGASSVKILKSKKERFSIPALYSSLGKSPSQKVFYIRTSRNSLYWTISAVGVFTVAVILLNYFSYVLVSITPRQEFVEVDSVLRASLGSSRDAALEVITFEDSVELSRQINNFESVEAKAEGRIVIFNAFSSEPQILVASTRFEAPNGKTYRLPNQILVPGAKIEDGQIVPQGVEAKVVADRAGEEYNSGLSDFTIPGFKGTPRFDKFYGRSKTEISGGFVGTVPVVSETDVNEIVNDAEAGFLKNFKERISKDLPDGVFLPEGAFEVVSEIQEVNPPIGSRGENVTVKIKGVLTGLALNEDDINEFLGQSYLGITSEEKIDLVNRDELSYNIVTKNFKENALTLKIKGRTHFVWEFDEDKMKQDMILSTGDQRDVFKDYDAILRAEINFKPAWWRIFPKDASGIKIERVLLES